MATPEAVGGGGGEGKGEGRPGEHSASPRAQVFPGGQWDSGNRTLTHGGSRGSVEAAPVRILVPPCFWGLGFSVTAGGCTDRTGTRNGWGGQY